MAGSASGAGLGGAHSPHSIGSRFDAALPLVCLLAIATGMSLLTTVEGALYRASRGDELALASLATGRLADWYTCAVLIPPLYWVTCRWPIQQHDWALPAAVHLSASSCAAVLKYVIYVPLLALIEPGYEITIIEAVSADFLGKLMFFWAAIGILHAVFFYRRERAQRLTVTESAPAPRDERQCEDRSHLQALEGNGYRFIAVEEIDWIEANGNYVLIHAAERRHLVRQTMAVLTERLDPSLFVRVHRSAIVRVAAVTEIGPAGRGRYRLTLQSGETLTSGRSFRANLRGLLRQPVPRPAHSSPD